jgi:uncharacterized membrane protein
LRRFVAVPIALSVFAAATLAGAVLWVERGLASAEAAPAIICFSSRDRARLAGGAFGTERKDLVVSKTIAFQGKPRSMTWWHLREATIHLVYTKFWRQQRREAAFDRIASKIRPCRW